MRDTKEKKGISVMKQTERAAWLALGVTAGAAFTYLFATREGQQLRKKVANRIEEKGDRLVSTASDIYDQGKEAVENVRDFISKRAKSLAG